ncbi:MAG: threonine/serine exporter family protein [Bacillota bacterium]
MIEQFFIAFFSVAGFAILFNIPKKEILRASFAGAFGWLVYHYVSSISNTYVLSSFLGACAVSIISEMFARKYKQAVTVFVIPGILPLVPGAGMYYTMLAIIQKSFDKAALLGTETIFIAGSISVAILLVSSSARLLSAKK